MRNRRSTTSRASLGMTLLLLLGWADSSNAEENESLRALNAYLRRHVQPISVTAQLDRCRALMEAKVYDEVLSGCFQYARLVLEEGMRQRRAAPGRSEQFEARVAAVVAEVAEHLSELSTADSAKFQGQLRELDQLMRARRLELSGFSALERMRFSLVSRGGVSLGNWQAGFLYLLTEWAKGRPGQRSVSAVSDPAFSTVTGASAGAVNGFAAAIEGCRRPGLSVHDSLYYRAWIGLGLFGRHGEPGLFPSEGGASGALSLFTDEALEATLSMARSDIEGGELLPSCVVDFGFVATHLAPTESPVHVRASGEPVLTTKKLKEKFAVRIKSTPSPLRTGRGSAGSFEIENLGPPGASNDDRLYYVGLGHGERVSTEALLDGVRASAAFPGAFPPVPLAYTQYVPGPEGHVVPRRREATFIDGGILDNTPVGLAVALDEWRDSHARATPHLEGLVPVEPRTYIFLEPLVRSWVRRSPAEGDAASRDEGMLGTYLNFTRDLLATTTDAQLANTAEQFAFVRRERPAWDAPRLSVPERRMPITGEQFDHFMAFLERDFRIFDFYVGMADAYAYLEQEACLLQPTPGSCEPSGHLQRLDVALKRSNPNYRCMRAYYESEHARSKGRLRTDQLPSECRDLLEVTCEGKESPDSERAIRTFIASRAVLDAAGPDGCYEPAIANHNFRALLAGMHDYKVWMQSDDYAESRELDEFFEALGGPDPSERFIYVDLPTHLGRNEGYLDATEVRRGFRALLQEGIDHVAAEQPGASEYALKIVGRTAADTAYGRHYPKHIVGLGVAQNGFEGVLGRRIGERPWRWDSTFRFFNLQSQSFGNGLDPFTGEFYLSTQVTRVLSPTRFADVEVGAGWALSETIAFDSKSPGHVAFRTGPRSYLALVLLQRLYLALNVDYYPVNEKGSVYRDSGSRVTDDWEFNLTGGWRFLF